MEKMYRVKNRSAGVVIYRIPEDNIRREFMPGETKAINIKELENKSVPYAVVMGDIDYFKNINDEYGEQLLTDSKCRSTAGIKYSSRTRI